MSEFLHNHPKMEKDKDIDIYHVIIDKNIYQKLQKEIAEAISVAGYVKPIDMTTFPYILAKGREIILDGKRYKQVWIEE